MDRNTNDDSNLQDDCEMKAEPEKSQVKVEPSDIELPPYPKPSKTDSEITPHSTEVGEYPLKRKNSSLEEPDSKKHREGSVYEFNDDSSSDTEEYYITISEIPKDLQISKYVEECELAGELIMTNVNSNVKLKFQKEEDYRKVEKRLVNDRTKGMKLSFKLSGQDGEVSDNASDATEVISQNSWMQNNDEKDPLGAYGLRLEFLRSLDITPPLDRWVHVTNFRCDKFELRDIMELAGRVLSCTVLNVSKKFAKVQFSHPLEAVQAVSMLNGQVYFGMVLSVCMERNPSNDIILPKGLVNIGNGLGLIGRPIRDIEKQYKKFIKKQKSTINPALFRKLDSDDSSNKGEETNRPDESQKEFKLFMSSSNRSLEVKHAEDLDSADGVQSEKDFAKGNFSPESTSIKSVDSPASIHEGKDVEKSYDDGRSQNLSVSGGRGQSDLVGTVIPIRLRQPSPTRGFPRPNINQTMRPLSLYSTRPGPSGPQGLISTNQHLAPFRPASVNPLPESRPNPAPHPMANPIGNPPRPGPFGVSQYIPRPQAPIGPNPVNNPGPVYGMSSVFTPGPVQLPGPPLGISQRTGPIHGPRPMPGPGPVHGPGPVRGPGPVHGAGPVQGPGPLPGNNVAPGPRPVIGSSIIPTGAKLNVEFVNLPPSTTFPFLCEKLSQCGQVTSLKFTTPGCAIATFGHPSHAERCFQNYNGMVVEGYRITVTLV